MPAHAWESPFYSARGHVSTAARACCHHALPRSSRHPAVSVAGDMPPRAGSAWVSPDGHTHAGGVARVQCHHAVCDATVCGGGRASAMCVAPALTSAATRPARIPLRPLLASPTA
eukprot:1773155-Pleurochrysis_carterae.AAC.1